MSSAPTEINPYLTEPDEVVLQNLIADAELRRYASKSALLRNTSDGVTVRTVNGKHMTNPQDEATIELLKGWNNPKSKTFQPTVFLTWDSRHLPEWLERSILQPYARLARKVVRNETDVVFVIHILIYLFVNFPSAIFLFHDFTWLHGIVHAVFTTWCAGPYTLLLHNHIHNDGVLANTWLWSWMDLYVFPYLTQPLMGHTWNSYYYHHVKHHHVEGNGPDDLSSTIRYQRDSVLHFLHYYLRFLVLIWLELPLYFWRKGRANLAVRAGLWEMLSMSFLATMAYTNPKASLFVLILPIMVMRLAMMAGNWGQHAFVDEVDPDSSYRSSITLIDVAVRLAQFHVSAIDVYPTTSSF